MSSIDSLKDIEVPLEVVESERWPEDPALSPWDHPRPGEESEGAGRAAGERHCFHSVLVMLLLGHTKLHGGEVPGPHVQLGPPGRESLKNVCCFSPSQCPRN